ncbi:MAG: polymorphic toxin type 33 domain-containing protein [Kiritimatiellae bacterium]|nr:polymorphic toxin type 33 domain-containing protein [Kiritimatiellia bacterium]
MGHYDAQDRLLGYGATTYQYDDRGTLTNKSVGGVGTAYRYDARGSLLAVSSTVSAIRYSVDPLGRRIAKSVNGTTVQRLVYQDFLKPIAELNADGSVKSRFVYATRVNVPDYMVRSGTTYRIITDHLGSVRLVVDAQTGAIAQRMDYDEWGNVLEDTNPGFQPFGFAGGLYDPDTGLTRFGYRDYDATTGRWLAKDPILFGGGQANLYLYCHGDSINYFDPWGLGEYQGTLVAGLTLILTPDFVTLDPSDAAWLKWAVYAGAFAAAWTLDNVIDIFRNSNPNQDKLLDNKEADKVAQEHGYKNAEDAKDQLGAGGKHDIYIRPDGTPVIKPKGGDGPGEPL